MKNQYFKKLFFRASFILLTTILFSACQDDETPDLIDDEVELTGLSKSYDLNEVDDSGIQGVALFEETIDGNTKVTLTLSGTPANGEHPAHIHFNSAAIGGDIAISLDPVDGATGRSVTIVSETDAEAPISYNQLLGFDGYINVHLSASDLATIVAQGDIGSNELTGVVKTYVLDERDVPGISGEIIFAERLNGFALATIDLENTPEDGTHPAHIHANSAAIGGDIIFTFNPVDGETGISQTGVRALDDDTPFGFADILAVDGYVNVHLSADELGTIVAQGDIGSNELTGVSITYPLMTRDVPGISGNVTFAERLNGFALATISLEGTPDDGSHPAHIHENSAAEGGDIIYTFNPVNGATGISRSGVRALDNGTEIGYEDILLIDGYVNVHLSTDDLATIVAQGDIGANF